MRLLSGNVRCARSVAPEDGAMQIATKTGLDDQFEGLSAQFFVGRNLRAQPFGSVYELLGSTEDLALNQTRATSSVRVSGGMATPSRTCN